MLVLDTNHLREIALRTPAGIALMRRLRDADRDVATTVVSAEEVLRGWLARVSSERDVSNQIAAYAQLASAIAFLAKYPLLPWSAGAAERFKELRGGGVRIGTMDLKIACTALEHGATVLSRNAVDFTKVPGLRFENWLD